MFPMSFLGSSNLEHILYVEIHSPKSFPCITLRLCFPRCRKQPRSSGITRSHILAFLPPFPPAPCNCENYHYQGERALPPAPHCTLSVPVIYIITAHHSKRPFVCGVTGHCQDVTLSWTSAGCGAHTRRWALIVVSEGRDKKGGNNKKIEGGNSDNSTMGSLLCMLMLQSCPLFELPNKTY